MTAPNAGLDGLVELSDASAGLETFVRDHYDRLIRLAGLICDSIEEAEDGVQTALEKAWSRRMGEALPAVVRPWLDRTLVRVVLRRRPNRIAVLAAQAESGPDREFRDAFRCLSARQRASLVLRLHFGYSTLAIARLLDASPGDVDHLRSEARRQLGVASVRTNVRGIEPDVELRRWFVLRAGAVVENAVRVETMTDRVATVLLPRERRMPIVAGLGATLVGAILAGSLVSGRLAHAPRAAGPAPSAIAEALMNAAEPTSAAAKAADAYLTMELSKAAAAEQQRVRRSLSLTQRVP